MIETFNDFLSVASIIALAVYLALALYRVTVQNRADSMAEKEARYYRYYDDLDDFSEDEYDDDIEHDE